MTEAGAVAAYLQILEGVGNRASAIGPRPIASHWPFVGSDYRRLLIVGRALAGWDDPTSPALWRPDLATTENGRRTILDRTRSYARSAVEPMSLPMRTRSGSSFWDLSKHVVTLLEPEGRGDWFSRHAWWNLFPIAWGDTNESPWFDGLWDAQHPYLGSLFWEVVDALDPTRVVILAGKDFWPHTASSLGLDDLPKLARPLIAGGVRDGRRIVWTYHPSARLKGVARPAFARAIADAI